MRRTHFPSFSIVAALMAAAACGHDGPFQYAPAQLGPRGGGAEVQLTFNPDQDYWPAWTEDGTGLLYAFIDATQNADISANHRCIGLMPATGGTRFWQWCDQQASQQDSANSSPAFALGSDGRLLYVEATSPRSFLRDSIRVTMWLADSAHPYRRRSLLEFPATIGDSTVSWLADLAWTGPVTFVGLGMRFVPGATAAGEDSVFYGEMVVQGVITQDGAALVPVAGTEGATGYSFADGGASIVFTQRDNLNLMKVPAGGGIATPVGVVTPRTGVQLFGVSCRASTCVVAVAPVSLWRAANDPLLNGPAPRINAGPSELRSVSLITGEATTIQSRMGGLFSCPLIAPGSENVVAQFGNMFGHLQTFQSRNSDLRLYPSLLSP